MTVTDFYLYFPSEEAARAAAAEVEWTRAQSMFGSAQTTSTGQPGYEKTSTARAWTRTSAHSRAWHGGTTASTTGSKPTSDRSPGRLMSRRVQHGTNRHAPSCVKPPSIAAKHQP